MALPRGLRNNNPGNIEYGDFARRHGAVGSDGRFAIFPDMTVGVNAMRSLLGVYQSKHGLNTVSGMINRWAPPGDNNDTSAYARRVAEAAGVGVNDPVPITNSLLAGMIAVENGLSPSAARELVSNPGPASQMLPRSGATPPATSSDSRVGMSGPGAPPSPAKKPMSGYIPLQGGLDQRAEEAQRRARELLEQDAAARAQRQGGFTPMAPQADPRSPSPAALANAARTGGMTPVAPPLNLEAMQRLSGVPLHQLQNYMAQPQDPTYRVPTARPVGSYGNIVPVPNPIVTPQFVDLRTRLGPPLNYYAGVHTIR